MVDDVGKLILRLSLGILVLLHGIAKITGGVAPIEGYLQKAGLPPALAFGVYIGEVLAPILVILGFYSRIGAALIAGNMLFAIGLVHRHQLTEITKAGGWGVELQAMFLFAALALVFMPPGRLSANGR
jgi:putative oxidoreductase